MKTNPKIKLKMIHAACILLFVLTAFAGVPRSQVSAAVDTTYIPANAYWTVTGIFVEQYHEVYLQANGVAITGKLNQLPGAKSGPAGQTWNLACGQYAGAPPPCALDDAPYGALVGKVGETGDAFFIGDAYHFQAPATGVLFLAVNDNVGFYTDNRGGFNIVLRGGNMAGGYIAARPDFDFIEGRYWTAGAEVRLKIFDRIQGLLYEETQVAANEPWDSAGTNISFDLAARDFDLVIGQRILMSTSGYTRELWVAPIAVTGFNFPDATITGVCDPTIFCWAHLEDRDASYFNVDGENWTARFEYLLPMETGWAFQWDNDGDETRIQFHTPASTIIADPWNNTLYGTRWIPGTQIALEIDDPTNGVGVDYTASGTVLGDSEESSWVAFPLEPFDLKNGDRIKLSDGRTTKGLVVSPLWPTAFHLGPGGKISGAFDPDLPLWTDALCDLTTAGETWTMTFEDLTPGYWLTVIQTDEDGDRTRLNFRAPAPAFNAWLYWNSVDASEFEIGQMVTLTIGDFSMETEVLPSNSKPWDPTESFAHFDLGAAHTLAAGDHVEVSDGVTTKELDIPALSVTGYDLEAKTVWGTYDPALPLNVIVNQMEAVSITVAGNTWVASFTELGWDWWGDAIQTDSDGDLALATIHTAE